MSDDVRLRAFAMPDALPVREVFAQSIEYLTRGEYDEDQRLAWVATAIDEHAFAERLQTGHTLIAEVDGECAGFGSLVESGDAVDMIYVHPHSTLLGVGTTLMRALERFARENGVKKLTVDASDTARPFFEKLGFEGTQRNLIAREDQWLGNTTMTKELVKPESGS